MSKIKALGNEIALAVGTITGIETTFTYAPIVDGEDRVFITPISQSYEVETRESWKELVSFQILVVSVVDEADDELVDGIVHVVQNIKDALMGAKVSTDEDSYYATSIVSSGTTVLSSSEIPGGLIDSQQYGDCLVVQCPVVVEFQRFQFHDR